MADEAVILPVALRLLAERGLDGMTTDEVAARARVSKTTLYRRWPSKLDLAVAAIEWGAPPVVDPTDGDPWTALRGLLDRLAEGLRGPGRSLMAGVIGAEGAAPELAAAWRRCVVAPRREAMQALLRRARTAGLLRADAEPEVLADALVGALFFRSLVLGSPIATDADLAALVDQVLGPWRT